LQKQYKWWRKVGFCSGLYSWAKIAGDRVVSRAALLGPAFRIQDVRADGETVTFDAASARVASQTMRQSPSSFGGAIDDYPPE
jgi:hypothetical protein